jgi:type III polyketide synthase
MMSPSDLDWATHPGGGSVPSGAERALSICPEAQRASYDRYINHGNSSLATIFSVMDRLREPEMDALAPAGRPKEYVVACAFGPGISVETCMLRRKRGVVGATVGVQTPPESESDRSDRSESDLAERLAESIDYFDLDCGGDGLKSSCEGLTELAGL